MARPSKAFLFIDVELTRRLREAEQHHGIESSANVIFGEGSHYSFVDAGAW